MVVSYIRPMPRGGKREGAGRKAGPALTVYPVKIQEEVLKAAKKKHGRKLHKMVVEFITEKGKD